jgi:hypothetical protein
MALWTTRYDELGDLSWIYFLTGIIALILLFADGTIRRMMINQQVKDMNYAGRAGFEMDIRRKIVQLDQDLTRNIVTTSQHRYMKKRLQDQLKEIMKH